MNLKITLNLGSSLTPAAAGEDPVEGPPRPDEEAQGRQGAGGGRVPVQVILLISSSKLLLNSLKSPLNSLKLPLNSLKSPPDSFPPAAVTRTPLPLRTRGRVSPALSCRSSRPRAAQSCHGDCADVMMCVVTIIILAMKILPLALVIMC